MNISTNSTSLKSLYVNIKAEKETVDYCLVSTKLWVIWQRERYTKKESCSSVNESKYITRGLMNSLTHSGVHLENSLVQAWLRIIYESYVWKDYWTELKHNIYSFELV